MSARTPSTRSTRLAPSHVLRIAGGLLAVGALSFSAASCCHCSAATQGAAADKPRREAKQFFYNAGAFAVGGTIREIDGKAPAEPLLVQAATLLPPFGGEGQASLGEKGFEYGPVKTREATHVIRIAAADTHVVGTREGPCYVTLVTNKLKGVNVLGRLKADEIALELTTRHCLNSGRDTSFRTLRADFKDLTIDGVEIKLERMTSFGEDLTASELLARPRAARGPFFDAAGAPDEGIESLVTRRPAERSAQLLPSDRLVMTSIFAAIGKDVLPALEKANPYPNEGRPELLPGNGIHVPNFGKVYFGRTLITGNKHETIMLYLELGSPSKGTVGLCGDYGNGAPGTR